MAVNLHERDIRVEAKKEGAHDASLQNARNLLAMNILTPEQISQATGLSLEEVLSLKESIGETKE